RGRGRIGGRSEGRRGARRREGAARPLPIERADAERARRPPRDGGGEEQRGHRAGAAPERTHGREAHPRDLPQARSRLGTQRPQACEGGGLLPERNRSGDPAGRYVELTADRCESLARARELVYLGGGDAEQLEAKRGAVTPHASLGRAAAQGAAREVDRLL